MIVDAIIPALDEEAALPGVIAALAPQVRRVVVADNGSRDRTAEVARAAGASVVREAARGYGAACLAAIRYVSGDPPEAVVFLAGDHSDDPAQLPSVMGPLEESDLVIGSRTLGGAEPGALTLPQRAGNALAVSLIRALWGFRYTDLGPFRAIRFPSLRALDMRDRGYGWTVEMQVKALRHRLRVVEVPVRYLRRRAGRPKISGTIAGTVGAGAKILYTISRHALP